MKYRINITRIEDDGRETSSEITLSGCSTTMGCIGPIMVGELDRLDEKATGKKINQGPIIDH